ncbi:MAG: calcium/sodium antiporter [Methanosarcinales archaeon]|nr:calcium/sodium antiporter [Methanosarcinales archaeon]
MIVNILLSVVGFALLIKCADYFVGGAASFARNLKIPTVVVGLTIVAFGTSAPELAISFSSHLSGNTDILFGNVIGSSISNIFVILGVAILIVPFKIEKNVIKKEIPILLLVTLGLSVLFLDSLFNSSGVNTLTRTDGMILILLFFVFIFYLIAMLLKNRKSVAAGIVEVKPKYKTPMSIVLTILGLVGVIIGSELVVSNLSAFAASVGISQKIIAVTIISIGTSLPELVTTVVAAKKGENSMAIGNIIGSNIFNICIVLGLPIVLLGGVSTSAFNIVDIGFMLLAVLLLWIFAATNRMLKRSEGLFLIAMYVLYAVYIFMQ